MNSSSRIEVLGDSWISLSCFLSALSARLALMPFIKAGCCLKKEKEKEKEKDFTQFISPYSGISVRP